MSKGVIIHLDNEVDNILVPAKSLFDQSGFDYEYIICKSKEEFNQSISEKFAFLKAVIFDLLSSEPNKEELHENDAEFLENIDDVFSKYNIPIFVYSGYLKALDGKFTNKGTIYKIDKAEQDIEVIFNKLRFLSDSGFLDVFSPGGLIEAEIGKELNLSFTNQFSNNKELEDIIESILSSEGAEADKKERVKTVFKRITIKSLANELLAPIADSTDKVHPVEHFYRRQSNLPLWTGDIWKNKENGNFVLVLTPRCDFATKKAQNVIFCSIKLPKPIDLPKKDPERILRNYLTDNLLGKSTRYIPANPLFPNGGDIMLNDHYTLSIEDFLNFHDYNITLSDDLTNEVIGKFAYYFLRTGITNINEKEFEAIIKSLKEQDVN